ncbi:MAG: hypothetical protein IT289_09075 [Oligoflexia bacterium]|nr:hypothetical protein [Oligoflexia bacterium]
MPVINLIVLLAICFSFSKSHATEIFENYISARAAGMGNSFTTIVDNKDALFYNPAGLSKIRGLHLTLLDLGLGTDTVSVNSSYTNLTGSNYASVIREFYGRQVWFGINASLGFSMPNFAIAAYDSLNISFNLHNPAYSNVTMNLTNDFGIVTGAAYSFLPNDVFRLGVAVKRVTRYGARVPFGPSTLATLSNSQINALVNNYGTGWGLDSGLLIEVPVPGRPTFSAVWQDIGQTKFLPISGSVRPPPLDNNAVAGFGMDFDWGLVAFRPSIEFRHANLRDEQIGKKLHGGFELALPILTLRGGIHQGYWTAGVGYDMKYLQIEAATYGVEMNVYPGQKEDRRYLVNIILDLNMDPTFGTSGKPGRARPSPYQRR